MKTLALSYSISGNVVTLTGVNVPLSQILLIADATTGSVLYSIGGPAPTAYTQATNSTITLATAPGASDKLTIYYDNGTNPQNAPSTVTLGGGSAAIGTVGVTSLPALPTGGNTIGSVSLVGGNATAVKVDGSAVTQPVSISASSASSTSTFTATASGTILAANSNRKGVVLSSPSTNTGICYVTIGTTTTSSTAFSFVVNPGDIISLKGINNALTGIWSASSNALYVTELT